MQCGAALELVVCCSLLVVHLLSSVDETLLRGRNSFLLLNALLYPRDLVVSLDIKLDLLASEGSHFDLHLVGSSIVCAPASVSKVSRV